MYRRRIALLLAMLLLCITATSAPVRADTPSLHLTLGNPSAAATDPALEDNYLIVRPQYALSYRRADGIPRWVSWHLVASDVGPAPRCDCFSQDTSLPVGWNRVVTGDYTGSNYDRGHMTASEDRTATDADNAATFLMTNVLPQAPKANRGPWANLESASRTIAQASNELYIISGPVGTIGTLANGTIRIPAATWKAVVVLPAGDNDVSRVTTATRVIAIRISNDKDDPSVLQSDPWEQYRTTVDAIEAEQGDNLFSAVPPKIQRVIEARQDTGPQNLTLSGIDGDAQIAGLGLAFAAPLTVEVRDMAAQPVSGVAVTFAALGDAADARFANSDSQLTVTTSSDGRASATAQAFGALGVYRVEASIAGVYTPVVFTLTNAGFRVSLPLIAAP